MLVMLTMDILAIPMIATNATNGNRDSDSDDDDDIGSDKTNS